MSEVLEAEERYAQRHVVKLARRVTALYPIFYGHAPLSRVILEIRAVTKIAAAAGIIDPDLLSDLVITIFSPHPSVFSIEKRQMVMSLLTNRNADSEGRCRAIRTYLKQSLAG